LKEWVGTERPEVLIQIPGPSHACYGDLKNLMGRGLNEVQAAEGILCEI
jgi:hypothetical protein